ncbi:hypothetical protein M8J76_010767 [Diaphorina citri]|nr:hypothetical protein M8J76_010767 [Diaphorina citri]
MRRADRNVRKGRYDKRGYLFHLEGKLNKQTINQRLNEAISNTNNLNLPPVYAILIQTKYIHEKRSIVDMNKAFGDVGTWSKVPEGEQSNRTPSDGIEAILDGDIRRDNSGDITGNTTKCAERTCV